MAPKYSANPLTAALSTARGTERSVRKRRSTTPFEKRLISQFGVELAPSVQLQTSTFRAAVAQGKAQRKAGAKQLKAGAQTISDVTSIFKQGASAQAAAAAVAKARAVQEATGASDEMAAAFAQDLMMMDLQQQNAMEMAQFNHDLAVDDAMKTGNAEQRGFVEGFTTDAPVIATTAAEMFRKAREFAGGDVSAISVSDLTAQYISEYGADQPSADLFTKTVANIKQGMNTTAALEAGMNSLYGQYSGQKWFDGAVTSAVASTQIKANEAYIAWREANGMQEPPDDDPTITRPILQSPGRTGYATS